MEYAGTIEFIKQRMREMCIPESGYHYEPVYVSPTAAQIAVGRIEIKAFNEFYYLVNENDFWFTQIISDTGHFNSDKQHQNTVPEFSGHITIKRTAVGWPLGKTFADGAYTRFSLIVFIRVTIY